MKKQLFLLIIIAFISTCLFIPKAYAGSYSSYKVKYKCPVRTKADENSDSLMSGNDVIKVVVNQELEYIKTELGPNNGKQNQEWYAVKFDYAAREYTGYVAKACMYDVVTYTYSDDAAFEESIKSFPESYKPYLRKLHAKYPSWKFEIDNTGLGWVESVTAESRLHQSAISYLYPSLFYKDETNPNGVIVDGTNWYAPCYDAVGYYLDPRNFLNEKNIFMFESLIYNSSQDSSVQGILNNSFMAGTFTEDEYTKTYANAFIDAAIETGVSSTHLASRALQEMGTTMSSAASGTVPGYEGYYNFYNIGAYSGVNNYLMGLEYAKSKGWNSIQKAITGGALFISDKYVKNGKDTLYFQKFNVSSKRTTAAYTYEYMTNIMAPSSEATSIYNSYKENNKLNNSYTFRIPIYNDMTKEAYKVSRTDTVGGKEQEKEDTPTDENKPIEQVKPKVEPETKIKNAGYSLFTGYLSGIKVGEDMGVLRQKLSAQEAVIGTLDNSWNSKTSGAIATGDIVEIDNEKKYEIVIYGDINSDSSISVVDLLFLKKYILGEVELKEVNKVAADISKDSKIDVVDLLLIKKYILGEYNIEQ